MAKVIGEYGLELDQEVMREELLTTAPVRDDQHPELTYDDFLHLFGTDAIEKCAGRALVTVQWGGGVLSSFRALPFRAEGETQAFSQRRG